LTILESRHRVTIPKSEAEEFSEFTKTGRQLSSDHSQGRDLSEHIAYSLQTQKDNSLIIGLN
jgi:hypothetical protein